MKKHEETERESERKTYYLIIKTPVVFVFVIEVTEVYIVPLCVYTF